MLAQLKPLLAGEEGDELTTLESMEENDWLVSERGLHTVKHHALRLCRTPYRLWERNANWETVINLLPVFLQSGGLARTRRKPNATSYLDAVRGYAAVVVFNHHFIWTSPILSKYLVSFLREGSFMVDVFFIISGFVLTQKTLRNIRHTRDSSVILQCLASSTFRRYFRLFLSAIFGMFVVFTLIWMDLIENPGVIRAASFGGQFWDFFKDIVQFSNPFSDVSGFWYPEAHNSQYHTFLWTIPAEFRGSMIVFLYCTASYKMSPSKRMLTCWTLIVSGFIWNATYASLFLFGAWLAEQSISEDSEESLMTHTSKESKSALRTHAFYGVFLLFGVLLGSQPSSLSLNSPAPWPFLIRMIPPWLPHSCRMHFWYSIGAGLLLYGLQGCQLLHRPFNLSFSQYIGRLSFGIYVMQYPLLKLLPLKSLKLFVETNVGQPLLAAIINYVIYMFILLWWADYFTRVDQWVINLARKLEQVMFDQSPGGTKTP